MQQCRGSFLYERQTRVPVYVFNLLESSLSPKLKTVPQKHTVMYPSSHPRSQSRQVLKRITSVHSGAGGVHGKTKAKIKYHCRKLYKLCNF